MGNSMSRQHFVALADDFGLVLRRIEQTMTGVSQIDAMVAVGYAVDAVASSCAQFNSTFDRQRFTDRVLKTKREGLPR